MNNKHYDYFVIGAGSGGVRSARYAASHGAKVGIAESGRIGGTCVNVGCVPKKLMAYAADYGGHFEDARGYGWSFDNLPSFDWQKFITRKDAEITRLNDAYTNTLAKHNVDIVRGHGKFIDANTVDIDGTQITADHILIATGGQPRRPSIPGGEHAVTSDEVFYLSNRPDHILIVGGGYIAVEFAHIFHGMGSKVTLCYRGELFMRGFDRDIREMLAKEMRSQGINLYFECGPEEITKNGADDYTIKMSDGKSVEANLVMAAIGRTPNLGGVGLEDIGVERLDNGQIKIDENYETSVKNIYAVGDIANNFNLTPVATAEGGALANRLFNKDDKPVNYNYIATAVFSKPNIATVGMSEEEARDKGLEIDVQKADFKPMLHQLSGREERTFMKIIVARETGKVIGLHMLGLDAPEIMQGFAVALNAGATYADFRRTIGIHPTSAEEFVTT